MKFITLQDTPTKQFKDSAGKINIEATTYNKVTVPVNQSLGFAPMWAIPITTFKETLANILLCAPNYPRLLCVFETDHYVRIDKLQHYHNIMNNTYTNKQSNVYPLADNDLPNYLTEYCLDISKLTPPLLASSITTIDQISKNGSGFNRAFDITDPIIPTSDERQVSLLIQEYLKHTSKFTETVPANDSLNSHAARNKLYSCWSQYRYTMLPVILSVFCSDTIVTDAENPHRINFTYLDSCCHNLLRFIELSNDEATWSYHDCSLKAYHDIYQQLLSIIIDDKSVLERLFLKQPIGRNEKCPCGSGIKFKKCHGRGIA